MQPIDTVKGPPEEGSSDSIRQVNVATRRRIEATLGNALSGVLDGLEVAGKVGAYGLGRVTTTVAKVTEAGIRGLMRKNYSEK